MGDVALTVPVVQAALEQNPKTNITILTRKAFVPLFHGLVVEFVIPDLYGHHKGVFGLFRLYKELRAEKKWDAVLDLHDVLRSKILRTYFKLSGTLVHQIDKGRKEKKALTSKGNKAHGKLKHTSERYADVFRRSGYELNLSKIKSSKKNFPIPQKFLESLSPKISSWIGIAPFAQHDQKMYPLEKMQRVVDLLAEKGHQIFVFGGGENEKKKAEELSADKRNVTNLIGRFSLENELGLLSKMDLILSMDSANMHMTALTGTKVVSIWGATHPNAGFTPFGQEDENQMIQISSTELPCRPCSVFGNKPCHREDFACMNRIEPEDVVKRLESFL